MEEDMTVQQSNSVMPHKPLANQAMDTNITLQETDQS